MTDFDLEMQKALEADGEKLRQLTGEDHGPYFIADETAFAPCPYCFESSGYVWEHGNDWNSGPWSHQTNIPCAECHGSGLVPCDEPSEPDDRAEDFEDGGYVAALDAEGKLVLFDELAEKVADLVRDAFYDGCEAMQTWNGTLGPMSQDELFAAWMESEARKQLLAVFPTLTNGVRSA